MTTFHVACPVCRQMLEYEHAEGDAWGSVSVWDYGTVEVTAHDHGVLAAHRNSHTFAEWAEVQERMAAAYTAMAAKMREAAV